MCGKTEKDAEAIELDCGHGAVACRTVCMRRRTTPVTVWAFANPDGKMGQQLLAAALQRRTLQQGDPAATARWAVLVNPAPGSIFTANAWRGLLDCVSDLAAEPEKQQRLHHELEGLLADQMRAAEGPASQRLTDFHEALQALADAGGAASDCATFCKNTVWKTCGSIRGVNASRQGWSASATPGVELDKAAAVIAGLGDGQDALVVNGRRRLLAPSERLFVEDYLALERAEHAGVGGLAFDWLSGAAR